MMQSRFRATSGILRFAFAAAFVARPGLAYAQDSAAPPPADAASLLPHDLSPMGMFLSADIVVKAVIIMLAFASVVTWTVWIAKSLELAAMRKRERSALAAIGAARGLADAAARLGNREGPVPEMTRDAIEEIQLSIDALGDGTGERIASRVQRIEAAARRQAARHIGVLATIGATAPFVGLFGTVWGIMNSFLGIAKSHTTNLAVVAPGIAEALLATAAGLVAAIPAVIIYNLFSRMIAEYRAQLGDAGAEVQRLASRDLDRRQLPLAKAAE